MPEEIAMHHNTKEDHYRIGIAKNGDSVIAAAGTVVNSSESYFVDSNKYETLDDAQKALLAYKLLFGLHMTPTDRCITAGYLRRSIHLVKSQENKA